MQRVHRGFERWRHLRHVREGHGRRLVTEIDIHSPSWSLSEGSGKREDQKSSRRSSKHCESVLNSLWLNFLVWALKSQNSAVADSRVQFELNVALSPRDGFCFHFCDCSQGTLWRNGPMFSGCIEGPRSSCLKTLRWKALSLESDVSSWIRTHRNINNTVFPMSRIAGITTWILFLHIHIQRCSFVSRGSLN